MITAVRDISSRYVFISTDYVFDGSRGPHTVDEKHAPVNIYGEHKSRAESRIANELDNYVIIRSCNLYGWQPTGKNFVMAVMELGRSMSPMRIPSDQWGNPTYADDLAVGVCQVGDSSFVGAIHMAGPDYVDRPDWARRAAEEFGLDGSFLKPVPTEKLGQVAPRPLRGGPEFDAVLSRSDLNFVDSIPAWRTCTRK